MRKCQKYSSVNHTIAIVEICFFRQKVFRISFCKGFPLLILQLKGDKCYETRVSSNCLEIKMCEDLILSANYYLCFSKKKIVVQGDVYFCNKSVRGSVL